MSIHYIINACATGGKVMADCARETKPAGLLDRCHIPSEGHFSDTPNCITGGNRQNPPQSK